MTSHAECAVAELEQAAVDCGYGDYTTFAGDEVLKLRAVAEVLAMLDGNAFFGLSADEDPDISWKQYLPEAKALFEANGGDYGWAGQASFARRGADSEQIAVEALAEIGRLRSALERIAESQDRGRHDGLPEEGPALDEFQAWLLARDALGPLDERGDR